MVSWLVEGARRAPEAGSTMNAIILSCLGLTFSAPAPTPTSVPGADLVRRLGDSSYAVRERASDQLREMGRDALPALRRGAEDSDPEVRRRCAELLARAERSDLDLRLDAFLEGGDDPRAPLAGWSRFQGLVGDDPLTRAAFVGLYRHDAALLATLEKDPKQAGPLLIARSAKLQKRFNWNRPGDFKPAPDAEVTALALLAAASSSGDPQPLYQFSQCLYLPGMSAQIRASRVHRRLLERALMRDGLANGADEGLLNHAVYLARQLGLTELQERLRPAVARLAEKAVANKNLDEVHRLTQVVGMAQALDMKELIDGRLKPAVRQAAKEAAARPTESSLQQLYYTAQPLEMKDVIDEVLRPAARKLVRAVMQRALKDPRSGLAEPIRDSAEFGLSRGRRGDGASVADRIFQAHNLAQNLQLADVIEKEIKPAVYVVIEDLVQRPEDAAAFDQGMYLAQNLGLEQALDELVRPAAEQVLAAAAARPDDAALFGRAVNLAQALDMRPAAEALLKPVLLERARAAAKSDDLNKIQEVLHPTLSLGLTDVAQDVLKPAVLRALEAARKKPPLGPNAAQLMHLAHRLKLKEGADAAWLTAQSKDVDAYTRGFAVAFLAEVGGKEHIEKLEALLEDKTRVGQVGVNASTLNCDLRDVALAAIIVLHGRDPGEFDFLYPALTSQPFNDNSFSCFGFEDDASRAAALKKWRAARK
jgi:hypothetical protein